MTQATVKAPTTPLNFKGTLYPFPKNVTQDTIVLHCSATSMQRPKLTINEIHKWHILRGFAGVGYHLFIDRDGDIWQGRTMDLIGAGVEGHNTHTIHICVEGGVDATAAAAKPTLNYTQAQLKSLQQAIEYTRKKVTSIKQIKGHYHYANKACPVFDVEYFLVNGQWKSHV